MTHIGDMPEISARFRPAADVEQLNYPSGTVARFVVPGSVTDGQFGLYEWRMQPRSGGADAHFHKTFSESFFVTEGTVSLYDGAAWREARAGDFLYVPMGGTHAFRNISDEPASMLILFAPAPPRERYFTALYDIATSGRTLSEDEWTELYAQHDQYRAG